MIAIYRGVSGKDRIHLKIPPLNCIARTFWAFFVKPDAVDSNGLTKFHSFFMRVVKLSAIENSSALLLVSRDLSTGRNQTQK
jgi:hypothetical protein